MNDEVRRERVDDDAAARGVSRLALDVKPGEHRAALRSVLDFVDGARAAEPESAAEWFDVKLAVEEVCTNIIDHGYGATRRGPLEIAVSSAPTEIAVSIRDHAAPFAPEDAPPPDLLSDAADRPIGGLGWHLVRQVVDHLTYESTQDKGNHLLLVKKRKQVAEEGKNGNLGPGC